MLTIECTLTKGYRVASGQTDNTPFVDGTIKLQKPHFYHLGLDLSWCFNGTLNARADKLVNVSEQSSSLITAVELIAHDYFFESISWHPESIGKRFKAESFKFVHCLINFKGKNYKALIYQPVKETKIGHVQPENVIEILAEPIDDIGYGDKFTLSIGDKYLSIVAK